MSKVKFAIAGLGYIGKRHAAMIDDNPDAELVAVADIRTDAIKGFSWDVPFFSDIEAMLSNVRFDVLIVATPNGFHAEHAILGLQHGRHVLIEKPMALNTTDCNRILEAAESAGRQVFCVMQNRYSPPAVWLKKILDEGILGSIYTVQVHCYWNRDDRYYKPGMWKGTLEQDGGVLFAQFSHFVDIMYWLFGEIEGITAQFADFNHQQTTEFEDSGMFMFRFFDSKAMGSFNYSTAVWDKNFESQLTVVAEKGTVKLGGQYMNEVHYCHIENYHMPQLKETNKANDYQNYQGSAANHQYVIANVVDCLLRGVKPDTPGMDGKKVVEIIENVYRLNPVPAVKRQKTPRGK